MQPLGEPNGNTVFSNSGLILNEAFGECSEGVED
jgi:hypothetical protein